MEQELLISLLVEYRQKAIYCLNQLKLAKSNFNGYSEDALRVGVLNTNNGEIKFKFHGIGCLFKLESGELIDIDFGYGRIDQIDKYHFLKFVDSLKASRQELARYNNENVIKALSLAVTNKSLTQNDSNFYLKNDDMDSLFEW